jgi:3-hydroxymyristoyl/3-hydroxydecanoyl-(acyl carrier protein) dehydratase
MDGHFRAFSLVDRITQLQAGKRAEGKFSVPAHLSRFSSCLAAEAAGQLAAWIAMAQLDFELRPVAGVAADLHFGADVRPGQTLDLAIEIDSCDRDTVNYSAHAYADGVRIIELERSAGPMLPMEAFDAPDAMRRRYELLCGPGAPAGEFPGVAEHEIEIIEEVHAKSSRAFLKVPHEAPFFSDHFPRRPVFPGTMLLDAHIQLALIAAERSAYWPPGARVIATAAPNLKLRAFIAPGDIVELYVGLAPPDDSGVMTAQTRAYMNGKQVAMGSLQMAARGADR